MSRYLAPGLGESKGDAKHLKTAVLDCLSHRSLQALSLWAGPNKTAAVTHKDPVLPQILLD